MIEDYEVKQRVDRLETNLALFLSPPIGQIGQFQRELESKLAILFSEMINQAMYALRKGARAILENKKEVAQSILEKIQVVRLQIGEKEEMKAEEEEEEEEIQALHITVREIEKEASFLKNIMKIKSQMTLKQEVQQFTQRVLKKVATVADQYNQSFQENQRFEQNKLLRLMNTEIEKYGKLDPGVLAPMNRYRVWLQRHGTLQRIKQIDKDIEEIREYWKKASKEQRRELDSSLQRLYKRAQKAYQKGDATRAVEISKEAFDRMNQFSREAKKIHLTLELHARSLFKAKCYNEAGKIIQVLVTRSVTQFGIDSQQAQDIQALYSDYLLKQEKFKEYQTFWKYVVEDRRQCERMGLKHPKTIEAIEMLLKVVELRDPQSITFNRVQMESMLEKAKREDSIQEEMVSLSARRHNQSILEDLSKLKEIIKWRVKYEGPMNHTTLEAIALFTEKVKMIREEIERLDDGLHFPELKKFKKEVKELLEPGFIASIGNEEIMEECERLRKEFTSEDQKRCCVQ